MTTVKPTRSELMKLKKQIKLAKSGHSLLKKKRDGLILDFFEILKKAKTLRKELTELYVDALENVNIARALEGDRSITSLALAIRTKPVVSLGSKNIMGVVVPKIKREDTTGKVLDYGTFSASPTIDSATAAFDLVVAKIIEAAEIETALKKLLIEIEKTKRRVNALEFEVIPKMQKQLAFIKMRLEEMERENIFRMKRIKGKAKK